jgi:hypothetical protein
MNNSDQNMVRYLLGELSETESEALEQAYFSDPQLFGRLVEIENELVDKYARGQLPPQLRDRFGSFYLSHPERRARAKFAEGLVAKVDQIQEVTAASPEHTESWWSWLLASMRGPKLAWGLSFALLLLIAGGVWFAIERRRLQQELAGNEAERGRQEERERNLQQQVAGERARAAQLASELDRLRAAQPAPAPPTTPPTPRNTPALATLILNISGVRSGMTGPPARLVIPPETEKARLQINLSDNDYQSYGITVQSAAGKQVFKRDGLRSKGKRGASLVTIVSANLFTNGDYILTLRGVTANGAVEDVSKSLFRVEKK